MDPWPDGAALALLPLDRHGRVEPVHGEPLLPASVPADRPYLALNMVQTVDGRVVLDGSANGLGSATDQRVMRRLRAEADGVLFGAETARVERALPRVPPDLSAWRQQNGLAPQPHGVVVSRHGLLSEQDPFIRTATADWRRYVFSVQAPPLVARPGLELRVLADGPDGLRAMLRALREDGLLRVVCEGGPTLNGLLLGAGAVDEIFVTVAPRLLGGQAGPHLVEGISGDHQLQLRTLYAREGELFMRYAVAR